MDTFKAEDKKEKKRIDSRKPAFFQVANQEKPKKELNWKEVEHEAYKKL